MFAVAATCRITVPSAYCDVNDCSRESASTMSTLPFGSVLSEVPTVLGLVLWQNLRYLLDWTSLPATERRQSRQQRLTAVQRWVADKRAEAKRLAPALVAELNIFDAWLYARGDSSGVTEQALADACQSVAAWAYTNDHSETGAFYADAAWQLDPTNLQRGIVAAKLARDAGYHNGAELLFGRVISKSEERKHWEDYIRAHLGLGILYMHTKQDQLARKYLERAANKARREGFIWLAAEAQHDLFQYMTVRDDLDAAEMHARAALALYPKNNPRLPFLVADAAFLLICKRHYSHAIALLRSFLRVKNSPPQNLLGLAMLVRALGAAGQRRKFERLRRRLLLEIESTPYEAAARWHLSEGERALGRWRAAGHEAATALELSLALQDLETAEFAKLTLREIETRQPVPEALPVPPPPMLEFVSGLLSRLSEWAPTKRGRPRKHTSSEWSY